MTKATSDVGRLKNATRIASEIVKLHGEKYLPFFQRLHDDLAKLQEIETKNLLALKTALAYTDQG